MIKSVLAIAALAAALSTAAFAGDVKSSQSTPMTDEQMDQVTAGHLGVQNRTLQVTTAGAPESGQFHQITQYGTGPDLTTNNAISNKGK